jgi:hypothetical protein
MTKAQPSAVVGKWRIFEADLWAANDLDLVEKAYIRFDADGSGEFKFICVAGGMDCGFSPSGADFTWQGFDEMDEASGSGEAEIGDDGILTIEIAFHNGDEATLKARPW